VHFHTNDFYACVNIHLTDNSNTAWVRSLSVPSGRYDQINAMTNWSVVVCSE